MRKIISEQEKMIKYLTNAQKREILAMQAELYVSTTDSYRQRTLRGLVTRGIVVHDSYSKFYTLVPAWLKANVNPDKVGPTIEVPKAVHPDPVSKPFVRPKAEYSNRSQEDLIDHVLKTYK